MGASEAALGFERDIKPLFRARDQAAMEWAFDLWRYEDVKANAATILDRLSEGEMPCDGEWPPEDVSRFRRWVEEDTAP